MAAPPTGEKGGPRYVPPSFVPGVERQPELARFLREQYDAIAGDLRGLHGDVERPPRTRARITVGGVYMAHEGDTLRVQPPRDTSPPQEPAIPPVDILLPASRPANKGKTVTIIVEDPVEQFTAGGELFDEMVAVNVSAVTSEVQAEPFVVLEGAGLRVLQSDGDGGWWILGQSSANEIPIADLADIDGLSVLGNPTSSTGPVTAVTATGRRQFLASGTAGTSVSFQTLSAIFPGAPIYDVMASPFNATGDGVADDTAALNAAIAAANATPGIVYLGSWHRITAALTAITGNNVWVVGRGPFNGGTIILSDPGAAIDTLRMTSCQYSGFANFWIAGQDVFASGWGIRLSGTYRCTVRDVLVSNFAFGVEIGAGCTLTDIVRCNLTDLYSTIGFLAQGTALAFTHATSFYDCVSGTDYPLGIVGPARIWAPATAYVVGNVVFANSALWQCSTAGTSAGAGTGPSGFPTTNPSTVHTTDVVDGAGTLRWRFAMPLNSWWLHGSYAHTFEAFDCGALQGGYGYSVEDTTPGVGSTPTFSFSINFQADHCFSRGIRMVAGAAGRHHHVLITSVMEGTGVEVASTYSGNYHVVDGEVFGCNQHGVQMFASHGLLSGLQIGGCSQIGSATCDAIQVGFSANHISIVDCSAGSMFGATSPLTRYGVQVFAGSDNYIIENNRFIGNVTAPILNTPGVATTRIVRNNIPDTTTGAIPDADYGDITVSSSGTVWNIDASTVGETERAAWTAIENTSTGTVNDYDTSGAQDIMFSGSNGTLTGVVATNFKRGALIAVGHQGTGYTQLNDADAGSTDVNRFNTAQDKNLRLVDDEYSLWARLDISAGGTTNERWMCLSHRAPFANCSDNVQGDILTHNGTDWVRQGIGTDEIVARTGGDVDGLAITADTAPSNIGEGPISTGLAANSRDNIVRWLRSTPNVSFFEEEFQGNLAGCTDRFTATAGYTVTLSAVVNSEWLGAINCNEATGNVRGVLTLGADELAQNFHWDSVRYLCVIFRAGTGITTANTQWAVGLVGSFAGYGAATVSNLGSTSEGIFIEYVSALSANLRVGRRTGGSTSTTDTGVAMSVGDRYVFEWFRTAAGVDYYYLNGTLERTDASGIAPTGANCTFYATTLGTTVDARAVQLDRVIVGSQSANRNT